MKTYRFDQMAEQINDRVDNPSDSGVERYVGLEHLDADSLRVRRWGEITDVESTKLRFQPGDIIFGKRRVYQRKLAVADFEGICSAHAMVLRARPKVVLPDFLPFFMQSDLFMERALEISVGSLSPTINWKTLAAEEFALPPLEEQRRLVDVVSASLDHVRALESLYHALLNIRMAIIQQFEEAVSGSAPGALLTLASLGCSLESGKSPASSGEQTSHCEHGVLKVSAVGDWEFHETENKAIAPSAFVANLEVAEGDVLVTRANADPDSVGRSCIVETTRPGLMLSDKTWRLQLTGRVSRVSYGVLAWTKCRSFRRHVRNHLNGTDAKNISQERFLAGPAPVIDADFAAFDASVRLVCKEIDTIRRRVAAARRYHALLADEVFVA